jgi:carbamoyl-phosphate synthase small subunit
MGMRIAKCERQELPLSTVCQRRRQFWKEGTCSSINVVAYMHTETNTGQLVLEDGTVYVGRVFGFPHTVAGEVVFNTGMVGYPEALTDPSYKGQILVLTYPLIGNYGVPTVHQEAHALGVLESERVQIAGLIVSEASWHYSHWNATMGLAQWLAMHSVPALAGIDTRALTKRLRDQGSMLGKIVVDEKDMPFHDPNTTNLVAQVSVPEPVIYPGGPRRVVVIDCGCKLSIIRGLLARGLTVIRVPWDYDFLGEDFDAVLISNGPGDPLMCTVTIAHVKRAMEQNIPLFGICLGHQILALAAGATTYKMKFGHRSQNQPCLEAGTPRCYITSQNHGYAVDSQTLPAEWEPWFTNGNDHTNEGLRHRTRPFMSVQFHPEAAPGPVDTRDLFDIFVRMLTCTTHHRKSSSLAAGR